MKPRIKIETYGNSLAYNIVWPDGTGFRFWVLKERDWKARLERALTKLLTEEISRSYRSFEGLWVACSMWDADRIPKELVEAINASPSHWKIP